MRVSVIGLGKLGAPLAAVLAAAGHDVVGVDVSERAVHLLNQGVAPVEETGLPELLARAHPRLRATTDVGEAVASSDVSFVIVPTPSDEAGAFSIRFVLPAVEAIGKAAAAKDSRHVVVITSTVMPGATGGPITDALEQASGLVAGDSIGLCYSPEFIALGSVIHDMLHPDFILAGASDDASAKVLSDVLLQAVDGQPPVMHMNLVNAELAKISVNTFVTTKISYANMLAEMCERLPGADVDVVTRAIGLDTRIGSKYLRGATPYGGPCFPRDNVAFSVLARSIGAVADLAEATDTVNRRQVDRLVGAVEAHLGPSRTAAVLGLSYKPSTPVVDESAGVALAAALVDAGIDVVVHDPVALDNARAVLGDAVRYAESVDDAVADREVVVVATAWPDYAAVRELAAGARAIVDCWRTVEGEGDGPAVVRLGCGPDFP